jgi:hypothetical protein
MGKNERDGNRRKRRSPAQALRTPELGYYLIFMDAKETERNYLRGLRDSMPKNAKNKIVIKIYQTDTIHLIRQCKETLSLEPQYRIPWIVFDRDQVKNFDTMIAEAEQAGLHVGWSNPCIEIWFHAYFGEMPACVTSTQCCDRFARIFEQKSAQCYHKADRGIYAKLCKYGNEATAISLAKKKYAKCSEDTGNTPSRMFSATSIFVLISEINEKLFC